MSKEKTVAVKFLGDDHVLHHITYAEEKKPRRQQKKNLTYSKSTSGRRTPHGDVVEDSSDGEDVPVALNALQVTEGHVAGSDVFQFRTPKRVKLMAQKASEARKAASPAHPPHVSVAKTPDKNPRSKSTAKPTTTTPYRLRKRNEVTAEDSSSEESMTSEEEESNDDSPSTPSKTSSKTPAKSSSKMPLKTADLSCHTKAPSTPRGRGRSKADLAQAAELYFDLHADAGHTSDRTLAKLDMPQLDRSTMDQLLSRVSVDHRQQRAELHTDICQGFPHWMLHMLNGFNVLLYGLGSKSSILEEFRQTHLKDFSHLTVNGYFPSLTLRQILNSIIEDLLDLNGSFKSPLEQYDFIKKTFEESEPQDMFLVIHNIDGPMLRGEKVQNILSMLAQIRGIHVIASVDHINAPLIWDLSKSSRFNWVWQDATTFESYKAEISYENSLMVQHGGAMALSSLTHVMNSLTPNARGIFLLLMRHQLDHRDDSTYTGLSFQELYQRCREVFLVNSDLTLRAQLIEFTDHKLIRIKKNLDGVEQLWIPISAGTLAEFQEQQEGEGR